MSKIQLSKNFIRNTCKLALAEDLYPSGDITSNLLDNNSIRKIKLISNEKGIIGGLEFANQTFNLLDKKINIQISNVAFPILFLPFVSRASEILGKRIFIKLDEKEFILNFNQSILSNYSKNEIWENANIISITFLENDNSFNDKLFFINIINEIAGL